MNIATTQHNKIHPHKMLMWVAMGSILMMFAGWISAFVVRKSQGNWQNFELPTYFWISTIVIIISSFTIFKALQEFKKRNFASYKTWFLITALLGITFMAMQVAGFINLYHQDIKLNGNPSSSFLYVLAGVHGLHMLGGVIAIIIMFLIEKFRKNKKVYSANGLEIMSIYWHFVDVLWIVLFVFLILNLK